MINNEIPYYIIYQQNRINRKMNILFAILFISDEIKYIIINILFAKTTVFAK